MLKFVKSYEIVWQTLGREASYALVTGNVISTMHLRVLETHPFYILFFYSYSSFLNPREEVFKKVLLKGTKISGNKCLLSRIESVYYQRVIFHRFFIDCLEKMNIIKENRNFPIKQYLSTLILFKKIFYGEPSINVVKSTLAKLDCLVGVVFRNGPVYVFTCFNK
ncbi:hypothetical protein RF11_01437 [Thelohanellus kitauei]|uniref:Uncharacterized protein n=1 Tax=Thelohanellus kitauei TaxID=669202 RepID=A0A0C2MGK2_THEKT|nr:hypothetical protein RF11_01437 [Thelohanellus kitauei]